MSNKLRSKERMEVISEYYIFNIIGLNLFSLLFSVINYDTYNLSKFTLSLYIIIILLTMSLAYLFRNKFYIKLNIVMFSLFFFVYSIISTGLMILNLNFFLLQLLLLLFGISGSIYSYLILKNIDFSQLMTINSDTDSVSSQFYKRNVIFKTSTWIVIGTLAFTLPVIYLIDSHSARYVFGFILLFNFMALCSFITFNIYYIFHEIKLVQNKGSI